MNGDRPAGQRLRKHPDLRVAVIIAAGSPEPYRKNIGGVKQLVRNEAAEYAKRFLSVGTPCGNRLAGNLCLNMFSYFHF